MSIKAGALLWNRKRVSFAQNQNSIDVDTGLTQVNRGFDNDPSLAERVQVIPLAPLDGWTALAHGEPFLDPTTNTIHVIFQKTLSPEPPFQFPAFNVLFWNPHTSISPGQADTYNPPIS